MAHLNDPVTAGAGVVAMRNDEEFLVLRRTGDRIDTGTWSLPGGQVDAGESPLEGVVRELREETNAIIVPEELQPLGLWTYERWEEPYSVHFVTLYFIGDITNPGQVYNVEPHKHDELRWVTWDTLPQPTFSGLDQIASLLG